MDNAQQAGRGEGVEWRGQEWSGGDGSGVEGRGGEGRAGQGRVPDCLGGLSRVGISSRSTRPWNGQPPSYYYTMILGQLGNMKKKKNVDRIAHWLPIEIAKALGDEGAIWMTGVLNEAMQEGIPEE